ncbi:p-loop containing nucleoside triphosphate hydrolase [Stemphylium lycopersici]|nr:p-loop containing nucleoside triphosphate hydrolase [Stemphylium lycopersici]
MEPLTDISLASAILQIVQFSSTLLHGIKDKQPSTSRAAAGQNALFEAATGNLNHLSRQTEECRRISSTQQHASGQKTPDAQLIALAKDSELVGKTIHAMLHQIQRDKEGDGEENVLIQGLHKIYGQKATSAITARVNSIQEQVNTVLLMSLLQHIKQRRIKSPDYIRQSRNGPSRSKMRLLATLQHHDWKPAKKPDLLAFSNALASVVSQDVQARFCSLILARLYSTELPDRYRSIPDAEPSTLNWIFDDNPTEWYSYSQWLSATDDNNLYWVSGKPGSGKSTLLKHLFSHSKTAAHLQTWSAEKALVKAGFFFWNSGHDIQTQIGLLQTLLYSVLRNHKKILMQLFEDRWKQFSAFGGGLQSFTWHELRRAFTKMISTSPTPRAFFFMIDTLDGFDGDRKELVWFILEIIRQPHVKVCVASRSWPEFVRAFEGRPRLRLDRLNQRDIYKYVAASLANNEQCARLSMREPKRAADLIQGITKKSAGVFLWAYIVVQSLLGGLLYKDHISHIIARLAKHPPGLTRLFTKLLGDMDEECASHVSQLFRLVMTRRRPRLLELWFADSENDDPVLRNEARFISKEDTSERLALMNSRLVNRCKGFLEVEGWRRDPSAAITEASHIDWAHRIARDFVRSKKIWNEVLDNTAYEAFDPEWHWANGQLGVFKAVAGDPSTKLSHFTSCIEYALRLEYRLKVCPVKFLDEVGRTAAIHPVYEEVLPRELRGTICSFLEFAVLFNLASYVQAKGTTIPKSELLHAARFQGWLDAKQWEEFSRHIDFPGDNANFETSRKELDNALDTLLGSGRSKSRWQRAKRRFSGQSS